MPKFDFFCGECGLLFDKLVSDANTQETECKSCKASAKRQFKPHAVGVTYKNGLPPTATIDQLVGADADKRWGKVNELHQQANNIRKESNSAVVEVSGSGELRAASKETLEARRSASDVVVNNQ